MSRPVRNAFFFVAGILASPSFAIAQSIRYAPEKGATFAFDVNIEVTSPKSVTRYSGTSTYLVDNSSDEQIKLTYRGGLLETVKPKSSSFPSIPVPRIPRGPFGHMPFRGSTPTSNQVTIDPNGSVLKLEGDSQLPYLLGNVSLIPLETLSSENDENWTTESGTTVDSVNSSRWRFGFVAPLGPWSDNESKVVQPGKETTTFSKIRSDENVIVFKKNYRLTTLVSGNIPKLEMSGEGSWTFNLKDHFPEALEMRLELKHVEENVAVTFPITVTYQRVSPEVLAARTAEAKEKAAKAKELAERPITEEEKQELMRGLSSNDLFQIQKALKTLAEKTNVSPDPDIAKAVEGHLKHSSKIVVFAAERALPIWSPAYSKIHEINKRYRGPLHVDSTGKVVESTTPLFEGQIVQAREFGNAWLPARIQKIQPNGKVDIGILMNGEVIRLLTLDRRNIQLAPDEVEQPHSLAPSTSTSDLREWVDSTGKFKLKATFVKLVDGTVHLHTAENKELKIALSRLSESDRTFVSETVEASENPFKP